MKEHSTLFWPNLTFEDKTNTTLVLSTDVMKASKMIFNSEILDRTFLILIIFCVSWKHTSQNAFQRKLDEDDTGIENLNIYSMADVSQSTRAVRLFLSSTCGVLFVDITSLYF